MNDRVWWGEAEEDIRELLKEAQLLLNKVSSWDQKFHDYSFIVFPAAKAYEGFLKKTLLEMGLISRNDYFGKRFRIGRALNPSLDKKYRKKESVYDKLAEYCGGRDLPDQLWLTWKESRNLLFHWFPHEANAISLSEAEIRIKMVVNSMDALYRSCKSPHKEI